MTKLNELVICVSDIECIEKFYTNFGFTMPEKLKKAVKGFEQEQSIETQRELKKQLTIAITEIDDPTLNRLFKPVIDACRESGYEMQFEDDIDDMLAVDKESE